MKKEYSPEFIGEVIAMAWDDWASFDAIKKATNLSEPEVIAIMRSNLKYSSFSLWRKRVTGRKLKHDKYQKSDDKLP